MSTPKLGRPRIHSREEREIPIAGRKRKLLGDEGRKADPWLRPGVNPGGARWCTDHGVGRGARAGGRMECTAKRNGWERQKLKDPMCHAPAVRGTAHCVRHGGRGMTRQTQMFKGEATITAWNAMGRPAPDVSNDPGVIAMSLLQMSYLRVAAYGDLLKRQVRNEAIERENAQLQNAPGDGIEVSGLIGHKLAATNSGEIYETSEEIRALVALESQERDRAMEYALKCHRMGISDRLTSLAEQWGDVVAGRVAAMLVELNLTTEQQKLVPMLVQSYLGSIDMESIGK